MPGRSGQHDFHREAAADRQHHDGNDGFQLAHAIVLQQQDQQDVESGYQHAGQQGDAEQKIERNRAAQDLGQITGNDGKFGKQPQCSVYGTRVMPPAGLGEIAVACHSQPCRQALQQYSCEVRGEQHPEQLIAESRAAFKIGRPVSRVHVTDAYQDTRAKERPQAVSACPGFANIDCSAGIGHGCRYLNKDISCTLSHPDSHGPGPWLSAIRSPTPGMRRFADRLAGSALRT